MSVIVRLLSFVGSREAVVINLLPPTHGRMSRLTSFDLVITFGSRAGLSRRKTSVFNSKRCLIPELCMRRTLGSTWSTNRRGGSKDWSAIAPQSIWETQAQWLTRVWLETLSIRFRSSTTASDDALIPLSRTLPFWSVVNQTTTVIILLAAKARLHL